MFSITPATGIYLHQPATDFRKGIDGLLGIVKRTLPEVDPMAGAVFVFLNKSRKSLRMLFYDGQGFWLCQKRLSASRFPLQPLNSDSFIRLLLPQLLVLSHGGDFQRLRLAPQFHNSCSIHS